MNRLILKCYLHVKSSILPNQAERGSVVEPGWMSGWVYERNHSSSFIIFANARGYCCQHGMFPYETLLDVICNLTFHCCALYAGEVIEGGRLYLRAVRNTPISFHWRKKNKNKNCKVINSCCSDLFKCAGHLSSK